MVLLISLLNKVIFGPSIFMISYSDHTPPLRIVTLSPTSALSSDLLKDISSIVAPGGGVADAPDGGVAAAPGGGVATAPGGGVATAPDGDAPGCGVADAPDGSFPNTIVTGRSACEIASR